MFRLRSARIGLASRGTRFGGFVRFVLPPEATFVGIGLKEAEGTPPILAAPLC